MNETITIDKKPELPASSDYYLLRKKAMEYLQRVATEGWSDYNLHDPGITLAELFSYGITDLSYRQNLPIEDLLTADSNGAINGDGQALFTPYEILTTNPCTIKDYRKLLIDLPGVRNAWLFVKNKNTNDQTGKQLYIDCKESKLSYFATHHALDYKGIYDVHLELEDDNLFGDLNSGNMVQHFVFTGNTGTHNVFIELRLPAFSNLPPLVPVLKISGSADPADTTTPIIISGNTGNNTDISEALEDNQAFRNALRRPLYATFYVHRSDGGAPILTEDVPIVLHFYNPTARMEITLADIKNVITDSSGGGPIQRYYAKMAFIKDVVDRSKYMLHEHRNYCEDFGNISTALTEDFGICCDIEADSEVDLEVLQGNVYYSIFRYMNPPINFYSWQELMKEGYTVDKIFNGPQTVNGFIKDEELNNSELRKVLYTSDLVNIIMDIPGVIAVRNFSIIRISKEGNRVEVQPWQMQVSFQMLPRFYALGSKINFYKNNLPFTTDIFELNDTISAIKAANEKPKLNSHDIDINLPAGRFLPIGDYYPLMYSLPPLYNVSEAGPMPPLTASRLAEAKQLKAYLLMYDQVYANWITQVKELRGFFDTNVPSNTPTYKSHFIANAELGGVEDIYEAGYTAGFIGNIGESMRELYDRRNRIYNHLLARLGENHNDYLLLTNKFNGTLVSPEIVLDNKAELIKSYAYDSYNKARAINYWADTSYFSGSVNMGLVNKLNALLGLSGAMDVLHWQPATNINGDNYQLQGNYGNGNVLAFNIWQNVSQPPHPFITEVYLNKVAEDIRLLQNNTSGATYGYEEVTGGFQIICYEPNIVDPLLAGAEVWRITKVFALTGLVDSGTGLIDPLLMSDFIDEKLGDLRTALIDFAVTNTIIPVEHILLRPRNDGETLFNICIPNNCEFCGEEDPYNFRLTFLLCGDTGHLGNNLAYRGYAENTIRREVPAHLMTRICWLSEQEFKEVLGLYETWLTREAANKATSDDTPTKLARMALVDKLNNMRSLYPPATLHDCIDGNDDNRVFLGKTVIGKRIF